MNTKGPILPFSIFIGILLLAGGDAIAGKEKCQETIAAVEAAKTTAELVKAVQGTGIALEPEEKLTLEKKKDILEGLKIECE